MEVLKLVRGDAPSVGFVTGALARLCVAGFALASLAGCATAATTSDARCDKAPSQPNHAKQDPFEVRLQASSDHFCAVLKPGDLRCWGKNYFGQLGDKTREARSKPHPVRGLPKGFTVRSLSVAEDGTCVVLGDGTTWCWGGNRYSRFDARAPQYVLIPRQRRDAPEARQVVLNSLATCILTKKSEVWCWGREAKTPRRLASVDAYFLVPSGGNTCAFGSHGLQCWVGDGVERGFAPSSDVIEVDVRYADGGSATVHCDGATSRNPRRRACVSLDAPEIPVLWRKALTGGVELCMTDSEGLLCGPLAWTRANLQKPTAKRLVVTLERRDKATPEVIAAALPSFGHCLVARGSLEIRCRRQVYTWTPVKDLQAAQTQRRKRIAHLGQVMATPRDAASYLALIHPNQGTSSWFHKSADLDARAGDFTMALEKTPQRQKALFEALLKAPVNCRNAVAFGLQYALLPATRNQFLELLKLCHHRLNATQLTTVRSELGGKDSRLDFLLNVLLDDGDDGHHMSGKPDYWQLKRLEAVGRLEYARNPIGKWLKTRWATATVAELSVAYGHLPKSLRQRWDAPIIAKIGRLWSAEPQKTVRLKLAYVLIRAATGRQNSRWLARLAPKIRKVAIELDLAPHWRTMTRVIRGLPRTKAGAKEAVWWHSLLHSRRLSGGLARSLAEVGRCDLVNPIVVTAQRIEQLYRLCPDATLVAFPILSRTKQATILALQGKVTEALTRCDGNKFEAVGSCVLAIARVWIDQGSLIEPGFPALLRAMLPTADSVELL